MNSVLQEIIVLSLAVMLLVTFTVTGITGFFNASANSCGVTTIYNSSSFRPDSVITSTDGISKYDINSDSYQYLDSNIKVGERVVNTASALYNIPITSMSVHLAKIASPNGNISIGIIDSDDGSIIRLLDRFNSSSLTTSNQEFGYDVNYTLAVHDMLGIAYEAKNNTGSIGITNTTMNSDTGTGSGILYSSSNTIVAERANSSSTMIDKTVNYIQVRMIKTGSPTGTITIGVFDVNGTLKYTFGVIDASKLTTSNVDYVFRNPSTNYIIALNDRIGVKFTGGDASNTITARLDTTAPFDTTKSFEDRFNAGTWTAHTTEDMRMIIGFMQPYSNSNYSLLLDGTDDYVQLSTNDIIANNTSSLTITADIKPLVAKSQAIIGEQKTGSGYRLILNSDDTLQFEYYPTDGSGKRTYTSINQVVLNEHNFIGMSFNGVTVTFDINGISNYITYGNNTSSKSINILSSSDKLRIGHNTANGAGSAFFNGIIDNIRMYNTAKTLTQMENIHYNNNDITSIVMQFLFNMGTGNNAINDYSNYLGVMIGGATYTNSNFGDYVRLETHSEAFDYYAPRTTDFTGDKVTWFSRWKTNPSWLNSTTLDNFQSRKINMIYMSGISTVKGWSHYDDLLRFIQMGHNRNMTFVGAIMEDPIYIMQNQTQLENKVEQSLNDSQGLNIIRWTSDIEPHTINRVYPNGGYLIFNASDANKAFYMTRYVNMSTIITDAIHNFNASYLYGDTVPWWYHKLTQNTTSYTGGFNNYTSDYLNVMTYVNTASQFSNRFDTGIERPLGTKNIKIPFIQVKPSSNKTKEPWVQTPEDLRNITSMIQGYHDNNSTEIPAMGYFEGQYSQLRPDIQSDTGMYEIDNNNVGHIIANYDISGIIDYNVTYPATNILDSNITNYWLGDKRPSEDEFITLVMNDSYLVDSVIVKTPIAEIGTSPEYTIYTSNTTPIMSSFPIETYLLISTNAGNHTMDFIPNHSAKFIKINVDDNSIAKYFSVSDVVVNILIPHEVANPANQQCLTDNTLLIMIPISALGGIMFMIVKREGII